MIKKLPVCVMLVQTEKHLKHYRNCILSFINNFFTWRYLQAASERRTLAACPPDRTIFLFKKKNLFYFKFSFKNYC
jgi:hypothetical protein